MYNQLYSQKNFSNAKTNIIRTINHQSILSNNINYDYKIVINPFFYEKVYNYNNLYSQNNFSSSKFLTKELQVFKSNIKFTSNYNYDYILNNSNYKSQINLSTNYNYNYILNNSNYNSQINLLLNHDFITIMKDNLNIKITTEIEYQPNLIIFANSLKQPYNYNKSFSQFNFSNSLKEDYIREKIISKINNNIQLNPILIMYNQLESNVFINSNYNFKNFSILSQNFDSQISIIINYRGTIPGRLLFKGKVMSK